MASSFSQNIALEKPANGDYLNTWNVPVNNDWDILDTVLGATTNINAVAASGTITLTLAQYRPRRIIISGAITSNLNYQLPSGIGGTWSVFNNTTGNFTVTMSSAGGGLSTVLIQGYTSTVICDGTNVGPANTSPTNPGGLTNQVQYNSGGVLAGSSNLTFNGSTLGLTGTQNVVGTLGITGTLNVTGVTYLLGSSSGYAAFQAAAAGTSQVYTWPASAGSNGQVLTTNGSGGLSWSSTAGGVSTFSAGTTGLTPSSATSGAVILGGTLAVANGGTGVTTSTGSGSTVRSTSPTLVTPVLGVATATSVNGLTISSTTGTLSLANGSTLGTSGGNSITLTSSGATNVTLPTSGTLATTGQLPSFSVTSSGTGTAITFGGFIIQVGQTAAISENSGVQNITLPITMGTLYAGGFGATLVNSTGGTGSNFDNAAQVTSCSTSVISLLNQAIGSGSSGSAAFPINWYVIGHT